jgi:NAD(P)-dependent dehydrogenase (short-subunit alcohol dehydrogenase family)
LTPHFSHDTVGSFKREATMPWDVRGKTILVTGATSGIGLEASVALAGRGARVVMVGRDPGRTAAAVADVAARSGSREVSQLLCDFSSQAAIRRLAASAASEEAALALPDEAQQGGCV